MCLAFRQAAEPFRPMDDWLQMAGFYEEKAEEIRRLASIARDDSAKRDLTLLALEFERLAQHARRLSADCLILADLRMTK